MYSEITEGIEVSVEPNYSEDQSRPDSGYFCFSYRVRIRNVGACPSRLLSRHWIITDGHGQTHEVQGPGVVGEQPFLQPGEVFEYTSFCPLPTPTGNMRGTYRMKGEDGRQFDITIPLFFLRHPSTFN